MATPDDDELGRTHRTTSDVEELEGQDERVTPTAWPGRRTVTSTMSAPPRVLSRASDGNGVQAGAEDAVSQAAGTAGDALPAKLRSKFESALRRDLAAVRIHTGDDSQKAAQAVGAKAYTVGQDIHFGGGHFLPDSATGEHLLAHEVAHTVQQAGGAARTPMFKLDVSSPGDAHEVEADRAADAMVAGHAASISSASGVSRQVMREPEGGAPAGGAAPAAGGGECPVHGNLDLPEIPILEKTIGKLKFDLKAGGSLIYTGSKEAATGKASAGLGAGEKKPGEEKKETGAQVEVKAGGDASENEGVDPKLEIALKKQVADWGGWEGESSSSIEVTKGGLTWKGTPISFKHKWGEKELELTPVEFTLISYKEKHFKCLAGTSVAKGTIPLANFQSPQGYRLTVQLELKLEGTLQPAWEQIIADLIEKYGAECLTDAALSAGAAAGAVVALAMIAVGAMIDVSEGNDIGQLSSIAYNGINDYSTCYAAGIRGQAAGSASEYGGKGFLQGNVDREKLLRKYPTEVIDGNVDQAIDTMVGKAKAQFKEEAIARFKANNTIMTKVRDGDLPSDFTTALDSVVGAAGVAKGGTSAEDKNGRTKNKEMEVIQGGTSMAMAKITEWGQGRTHRVNKTPGLILGTGRGFNVRVRLNGYFDDWRDNQGRFQGVEVIDAFELNGRDAELGIWDGAGPFDDPANTEAIERAKAAVCDVLLSQMRLAMIVIREPMPDDDTSGQGRQGQQNVEAAHDANEQAIIDSGQGHSLI